MTKNLVSEVSIIDGIVVNSRPVNRRVTDANEGSHLMEKGQRASLTHSRWDGGGTGRVVAMATQLSLFICFTTHQIQRAIILFPSRFHRFQLPKEIQFDVSTSLAAFAKLKSSERTQEWTARAMYAKAVSFPIQHQSGLSCRTQGYTSYTYQGLSMRG